MIELEAVFGVVGSVQISLNLPGLHSPELIAFQIMTSVQRGSPTLYILEGGIK